ncbi:hypothetical protein HGRIS_000602 [Hohenbuehelia grisea]
MGISGKHLGSPPPPEPATAPAILSFGATIAGFIITYAGLASDFTSYFRPDVPSIKVFVYSYLGFILPIITLQCLGAASVIAAVDIPTWQAGYESGNVGGLLLAMMSPAGGFAKFLTVLLALSAIGNIAITFYSFCLNIQIFIPALVVVPRYVFSILATAIVIPLAIVGSHRFYETLANFLGLLGYWACAFIAIVVEEHLVFRHNDPAEYNLEHWNSPGRLPWGMAALGAGFAAFGVAVVCMDQVWFVGPLAKKTGDIGFEMAFIVSLVLYFPLRALEIRLRPGA